MDQILGRFLAASWQGGKALADQSDILDLVPFDDPPRAVIAHFDGFCYVKTPAGVEVHRGFTVGFRFPGNYLSLALPWEVMHFLEPVEAFHPNVRPPAICLGNGLRAGAELRELLFRTYELVTGQRRSNPVDALNPEASVWVRRNWPVPAADSRPLKWRANEENKAGGLVHG